MKINYEKAISYISTLYENDEASKANYVESTELKHFATVVDSDVSRMMRLINTFDATTKDLRNWKKYRLFNSIYGNEEYGVKVPRLSIMNNQQNKR